MTRGMVTTAVEGAPGVTAPVPTVIPSSEIVTVPDGEVVEGLGEVMYVVTVMEPPALGEIVEGTKVIDVGLLETLMVTACELELA